MRQVEDAQGQWPTLTGGPAWRAVIGWCRTALERRRQRIALAALNDDLLRDIGVTREEARVESAKPFWR
jgi:uncharacterized protein YjiS (DUF1127 family)